MIYTGDDKLYDIMAKDPENFAVCASGDSINFHDYYLGIKKRLDKGSYVYKVKAFDNNGAETEKTIFEFSVN